jgi:hypothetical protein
MKWKIRDPQLFLNCTGLLILFVGLVSAAFIYRIADSPPRAVLGYESDGGATYPIMPDDSKQYLRGLEMYGGTANVLADDLRRWFDGLWHGKSLAYTVAFITIVISAGALYAARQIPSSLKPEGRSENGSGKSG